MVSALDSGLSSPGSVKTLYSHNASLYPGVQIGTSKCAGGNPAMDWHPIRGGGGVAILLAAS